MIRNAAIQDLEALTQIARICFPPNEAATREEYRDRLTVYPRHFWVLEREGRLAGSINGPATMEPCIRDDMFENARLHREDGDWQAILGLAVLPEYRRNGFAAQLMEHVVVEARRQGRKGCILTCKKELSPYYQKFGYENRGVSQSCHGGVVWYDMRLQF